MSPETPLLSVEGISKSFPGVQALRDVHLALHSGEVLALVGENGAGKSTLMKVLAGIHQPDAGTIMLEGKPVRIEGTRQALEQGISIIHQEFQLMPDLSVAQNLFLGREPRTGLGQLIRDGELNRRAAGLLGRLGIPLDPRQRVGELSVAGQQMVEIAKSLSFQSRVLIMDEPTAALNETEVRSLFRLIRDFVSPRTGVIYISHRMDEINQISDRITVLRDGSYIGTLPTDDTPIRQVISLMVGRELAVGGRPEPQSENRPVVLGVEGLGTRSLLRDVSFDVHAGEILGFAGLMGAGRTEVARALVGADKKSMGRILVRGRQVVIRRPADAVQHGIGYLSEDRKRYGLLLDHDVTSNITLSSLRRQTTAGMVRQAAGRHSATTLVETLAIKTPSVGQLVRNLSGGNQQKVVIAKWLLRDCDVLIFDEPTRGIDVGAKDEIYGLLVDLAAAGKAIIMISSELPEVLRLAHRIVVMCAGRITGVLENAEADQEKIMELATQFDSGHVLAHSSHDPPTQEGEELR